MKLKIIPIGQSQTLLEQDSVTRLWGCAKGFWGTLVEVRDAEAKPLDGQNIAGFNIVNKETFFDAQVFEKIMGPFTEQEFEFFQQAVVALYPQAAGAREKQLLIGILNDISDRVDGGEITPAEAAREAFSLLVLAHEIGHHQFHPFDKQKSFLLQARVRKEACADRPQLAGELANLFSDLLVNNTLRRNCGLPIEMLYQKITASKDKISDLWKIYIRAYEILWDVQILPEEIEIPAEMEKDAQAVADIITRSVRRTHIEDGIVVAKILAKYMTEESKGDGSFDRSTDQVDKDDLKGLSRKVEGENNPGERRDVGEYQDLAEQAGLDKIEATVEQYLELAEEIVMSLPETVKPEGGGEPAELVTWEGVDVARVAILESLLEGSGLLIPETMVERVQDKGEGSKRTEKPHNVILYVDSSVSMTNAQEAFSPLVLGGTVILLAAEKAGAKIRAAVYSQTGSVKAMPNFSSDIRQALKILVTYLGGGTDFPFKDLQAFSERIPAQERPADIYVLSDQDFCSDLATEGAIETCVQALQRSGGKGRLLLNTRWTERIGQLEEAGYSFHQVESQDDFITAAEEISQECYTY